MSSSQLTKRDKYCYDFIRGMELCKNALEYFNNTYINDLTNKYAKDYIQLENVLMVAMKL